MPLTLIVDTTDQQQNGLYADWLTQTPVSAGEFFNADTEIDLSIQPVKPTTTGAIPWESDWIADDVYYVQIGNPDDRATGGTFVLSVDVADTAALAYNITAAALETALEDASVAAGYGALTVTKLLDGVFRVDWAANGTVIPIVADATLLEPSCEILVKRTRNGDASTPAQQIISIRQTAVASATLSTVDAETAPSLTQTAINSNVQSAIWQIDEGNAVSGQYSVTVTVNSVAAKVVLSIGADIDAIGAAFNTHSQINYQRTDAEDNIVISRNGRVITITFTGTLSGPSLVRSITSATVANPSVCTTSADHGYATGDSVIIAGSDTTPTIDGTRTVTVISPTTFSVSVNVTSGGGAQTDCTAYKTAQPLIASATDISLVYPTGVSGTLQLNTVALAKKFFETNDDEIDFTLQVKRERAAGEQRVIFSDTITLKRELIDLETLIPLPTATDWRSGSTTCSTVDYVDVAFASAMSAADYKIVECVLQYNGAGAAPYKIAVAGVEDLTTSGFRCWFSGNATTSYSLEYTVSR